MKQILLMIAVVALVGCGEKKVPKQHEEAPTAPKVKVKKPESPTVEISDPIVEEAIRKQLKKPTGELTEAELASVTSLSLYDTQITDAGLMELAKLKQLTSLDLRYAQITNAGLKELVKCKQLTGLHLYDTKVTKAGVAELKKALPKCRINHNAKK